MSGRGTLANSAIMEKIIPHSAQEYWAPSPGGQVRVRLDDFVGRAVYFFGDLDAKITWAIKRLARPGDCVIDIGANLGLVTIFMSKCVGANGRVLSFEPNPELHCQLSSTIAHNGANNVSLFPVALGDTSSTLTLSVPEGNVGAASLKRMSPGKTYSVSVQRLDDVLAGQPMIPSLIKIDVEGSEWEVLRGAESCLTTARPCVIMECNDQNATSRATKFLRDLEYYFFALPRSLVRPKAQAVGEGEPLSHDVIAVHMSKYGAVARCLNS